MTGQVQWRLPPFQPWLRQSLNEGAELVANLLKLLLCHSRKLTRVKSQAFLRLKHAARPSAAYFHRILLLTLSQFLRPTSV